jgi:hypothetical protein
VGPGELTVVLGQKPLHTNLGRIWMEVGVMAREAGKASGPGEGQRLP